MNIKYEFVLHGMPQATTDEIEHNNIDSFKNRDSNIPGYYIVQWTGNVYNLQEKYTCHAFDHQVIITEGELAYPAKFMTPMRKTSYWYH